MNDSSHPLRRKLRQGGTIAGVWADIPHPQVTGAIATAGFDFVILDCEHGGWDFGALEGGIAACETAGAAALVRSPGPDAFFIQRALDLGADGIVVPQIPDADAAARAVAMAHFAPDGTRGYNPFTRGGRYGIAPQPKLARGYPFTGVLVESPAAAEHLAAIVRQPLLDLVYLGVYDYSVALGVPGQVDDPRVHAFVERAARLARDAGKAVGTTAMNREQVARLTGWGVNVLLYGADTWLVAQGARAGLALYGRLAAASAGK
ncbi:MAG TPA: aldolase/citrate lyase family protein [Casimicrobiaceae bacterium]|nr:aldolase/citrate lyase family protein [Casimicrobiaceae bacterium]